MQIPPKKINPYAHRKAALKRKIARRIEEFSTRNYIFYPNMRSPRLPVYEIMEGDSIESVLIDMKSKYKHFYYTMLPDNRVEISEPIYSYEGYAERNLKPVLREIVEVGCKPQDERPPCKLIQLKLVVKRGRPRKNDTR